MGLCTALEETGEFEVWWAGRIIEEAVTLAHIAPDIALIGPMPGNGIEAAAKIPWQGTATERPCLTGFRKTEQMVCRDAGRRYGLCRASRKCSCPNDAGSAAQMLAIMTSQPRVSSTDDLTNAKRTPEGVMRVKAQSKGKRPDLKLQV
jgi:hypothetical protein